MEKKQSKVSSKEWNNSVLVRFINKTNKIIDVYWINYRSCWVYYQTLNPNCILLVNTFVSHPWIFRDRKRGELMHVANKSIYFPESKADENGTPMRQSIIICFPFRTLKMSALFEIAATINAVDDIDGLKIPQQLIRNLKDLYIKKQCLYGYEILKKRITQQ